MNDHHPYDQSLRDKLNRLPVPDVQKSWQDMRLLLDEEMPEDGRSRRRGGWWFFGAVLIFIIAGSWTLLVMNFSKQNVDPPLSSAKNISPPPATGPGTDKAEAGTQNESEKAGVEDDKILLSREEGQDNNENNNQPLVIITEKGEKQNQSVPEPIDPAATEAIDPAIINLRKGNKSTGNKATGESPTREKATIGSLTGEKAPGENPTGEKATTGNTNAEKLRTGETASRKNNSVPVVPDKLPGAIIVGGDGTQDGLKDAAAIKDIERFSFVSFAETIDSINKDYGSYITYAPVSRKYYRQNKKYGRPANIRPPYTTEGRSFAIGLSLPLVFPLGDQQALSYNVNAGPNTVTDYIPAPHAQYHFNSAVYLQSELQVLSPQYIKPALLYQSKTSNNFYQTTSSVSAQKLYYFNVPVSLHYSPFKHFYMGTGLQFSSLLSGVAMHEQQRTGMVSSDSLYTVSYAKFSNDSISNKLSGSEMRLMLDANYYWNKFTVGLRYNQALSNYVSTRAAPSVPLTVDKNKSIQFYLRYNLWEDKKRRSVSSQPLVLK